MRLLLKHAAVAALISVLPAMAVAGAWPREPGASFLSARSDYDPGAATPLTTSLYAEYGLTRRLTLGGQLSDSTEPALARRVLAFAQLAVGPLDATNRFSVSYGISSLPQAMGAMVETRSEVGLHWGRGFESRLGGGWMTATAKVLLAAGESEPITDVSALIGLRPKDGWMVMMSANRYDDASGATWKITPSIGYQLRETAWIVPSVTRSASASQGTSFGVALWLNF